MTSCAYTCGTLTFTRIGYFTAGSVVQASGEVAAAGYHDPMAVVDGWMTEPASADGHRVFLDGKVVGPWRATLLVECGPHVVKLGHDGRDQPIDVPCGGRASASYP